MAMRRWVRDVVRVMRGLPDEDPHRQTLAMQEQLIRLRTHRLAQEELLGKAALNDMRKIMEEMKALEASLVSAIWLAVRGRASESAAFMVKAGECRTSLFHQGHLWKSAVTQASHANQIRFSVPVGKGLAPLLPLSVRHISTQSALSAGQQSGRDERSESGITTQEDPFDTLTDKIPERPVSVAEGASYSIVILAGLAVAGAAAYAVFKELIFEPKEYKVFGKALDRVKSDMQVAGRLGSPISGYGQESQNRAARQRISNRVWIDEDGIERVEVMFHIRGPGGAGKVYCEMFKDPEDKSWKYTYLIVDVTNPTPKRFLLESYVPQVNLSPV